MNSELVERARRCAIALRDDESTVLPELIDDLADEIERLRAAIHDHKMRVKIDTHPANGPSLFDEVLWKAIEGSDDEQ